MPTPDDSALSLAQSLFADFLGHLDRGEPADLEALCGRHPEQATELRRLKAAHDALYDKLREARPRARDVPQASFLERFRQEFGSDVDPGVSLQEGRPDVSAFTKEAVTRLELRSGSFGRYTLDDEIARGGMGTILRVWDEDLQRWIAMKLIRARRVGGPARPGAVGSRRLGRFLEEAQVTGQLDHPGIVPVHELGLDAEGRVYFTMKLVEGRTLQTVFEELARGEGGWTQTRALSLILKVCEAMSYAHDKGVVHRDLKPLNVMVGRYGEVFVMDWGLARVLGREDRKDIRLQPPHPASSSSRRPSVESPLLTMDGDVVGTPAYMSPEQARGDVDQLDQRTDVYSLGAMLYQLLTGRVPYVRPGERTSGHAVVARVLEGPPSPVAALAPQAPAELIAICERAMSREAEARYPDISMLAEDVSAYLEGRVVKAYETGAAAEARKWIARNKTLAASLAAVVVLGIGGLGSTTYVQAKGREAAQVHQLRAETETAKVLRLSDVKLLQEAKAGARGLWPAHPDKIRELESWVARTRALTANLELHRSTLTELRERAQPWTEGQRTRDYELHARSGELTEKRTELERLTTESRQGIQGDTQESRGERAAELGAQVASLAEVVETRRTWRFDSPEDQWQHDVLTELITDLETLETGLLSETGMAPEYGWSVPRRLEFARELERGSARSGEHARAWAKALPAIGAAYPGLDLGPQRGLVPIGPDPDSGLWEFAHLMTGEPARRAADGGLALTEETGLIMVLLPGGSFWMGSQYSDPSLRHYVPDASDNEGPVHKVQLTPFFISKYEMTQGQWRRVTGDNPSQYQPGTKFFRHYTDETHPVESVSWPDCVALVRRIGLSVPSEAQWEYAARAGTDTPWWTGPERESLIEKHAANLADQTARRMGAAWNQIDDWPELDDGFATHAPIGTYAPNRFGLHEIHGNVSEWCLDGFHANFYERSPKLDPIAPTPGQGALVVSRGGGFTDVSAIARSARRLPTLPFEDLSQGLRPARAVQE